MYALLCSTNEKANGSHVMYERQALMARNMRLERDARRTGKVYGAASEIDENKELLITLRHALDEAIGNLDFDEVEALRAQIDALNKKSAGLRMHMGAMMQRRRRLSTSSGSSDSVETSEEPESLSDK